MSKNRLFQTLLVLLICVSIILPSSSASASAVGANDSKVSQQQLKEIAIAKLSAQNRILIDGLGADAINQEDANYTSYAQALDAGSVASLHQEKELLASHNTRYVSFQTELTVNKVVETKLQTTLSASEYTKYTIEVLDANGKVDPLAPTVTEEVQQHTFIFKNVKGKWYLVKDRLDNGLASVKPDSSIPPVNVKPLDINTLNVNENTRAESPVIPMAISVNKANIAAYARKYWNNYNGSYRSFGEDCTNFASQALRNGGWSNVLGLYTSTSYWWYNSLNQTRTWINAHYWFWFTKNRPRGYLTSKISDLQVGDIVQADWEKDGYIDHTMIVTKRDSNGTVYLTYHTNNVLDKSFWTIYSENPNANYYAWRLYTSTN